MFIIAASGLKINPYAAHGIEKVVQHCSEDSTKKTRLNVFHGGWSSASSFPITASDLRMASQKKIINHLHRNIYLYMCTKLYSTYIIFMHLHTHTYAHTRIHTQTHKYTNTQIQKYKHTSINTHAHIYLICAGAHVCVCVCVCVCV